MFLNCFNHIRFYNILKTRCICWYFKWMYVRQQFAYPNCTIHFIQTHFRYPYQFHTENNSTRMLCNTFLLTESQAFLKSIISWLTASAYSNFFSSIWRMQGAWSVVDLLRRSLHWWSPIISSAVELSLTAGCWIQFCTKLTKWFAFTITKILVASLVINRYSDGLLPILRQFLLILNRITKFWISSRIGLHLLL